MKTLSLLVLSITLFMSLYTQQSYAQNNTVVLNGSTTVNNLAFLNRENKLSEWSGVPFTVQPTSSGRGLLALSKNEADIAMISSDLETLIDKLNTQGHNLNASDYKLHKIAETRVVFGVHKDNPVRGLTLQNVQDLFTGRVTNWNELGVSGVGDVLLVTEHPTGGVYNTVVTAVLYGEDITDKRITMQSGTQVGLVISQNLGGFGMISDATPRDQLFNTRIVPTPEVLAVQKLYLATHADDKREQLSKLIQFVQNTYNPR